MTKIELLKRYLELAGQEQTVKQWLKAAEAELDRNLLAKYKALIVSEVKELVVEGKWLTVLKGELSNEINDLVSAVTNAI